MVSGSGFIHLKSVRARNADGHPREILRVARHAATIIPVAAAAIVTVFKVNPSGRLPDVIW
jgi:hypothetical protein